MKIKEKIHKTILSRLGRISNQDFLEKIFQLSLSRMNFGNGGDFSQSGELFVSKYIYTHFKEEALITIFDVGANVGNYSKALSEVFNSKAKIYSFEPSKKTYERFLETTKNYS